MFFSRLIIIIYALLFIPSIISQETNCGDIVGPESASDCKLSTSDKKNYEFCCYVKFSDLIPGSCMPFNYEDYYHARDLYDTFECDHIYSGCDDIKPEKESDCVSSQEDKDRNKPYCCYQYSEGRKRCVAYKKEEYQIEIEGIEISKALDENYVLNCGNEKSSSSFINTNMIFMIFIIMNILN